MSLILIPQISGSVLPANVHQRVVYKKPQRFIIYAHLGIDLEDRDPVPLCAASPITRWLHRRIGIAFNSKTRSLAAPRPRALPRRLCASTGARKATSEGQVERLGGNEGRGAEASQAACRLFCLKATPMPKESYPQGIELS
jgi:hypothetical protein